MCEQCQGFSTRFRVDAGREYHDLIRQLRDLTQSCVFKLLSGTVPLERCSRVRFGMTNYLCISLNAQSAEGNLNLNSTPAGAEVLYGR